MSREEVSFFAPRTPGLVSIAAVRPPHTLQCIVIVKTGHPINDHKPGADPRPGHVCSADRPGTDSTAKVPPSSAWYTHTHSFNCVILLKTIRPGLNPGPGNIHTCATASRSLSLKYAFNLKNLQSH